MLKDQIAASLELAFSQHGFAEPSVSQLKERCQVSLRTLYKYYPSKEAMIVAALDHRHQRYLAYLREDLPRESEQALLTTFARLAEWMRHNAPSGCMSMSAIAAFPDHPQINQAVLQHKSDVRAFLARVSGQEALATTLYLLHEGMTSAWPVLGEETLIAATTSIKQLMESATA